MTALIYSPLVALIVWYVAGKFGFHYGYVSVWVAVIVAKVLAVYLRNEPPEIEVVLHTKGDAE